MFNPIDFPIISTDRCTLNYIRESNVGDVFDIFNDDYTKEFLEISSEISTMEQTRELLSTFEEAYYFGHAILWGISLKESEDQLVGIIALHNIQSRLATTKVFYAILPQFRGLGLMRETLARVTSYCVDNLSIKSIELDINDNNTRSISLAKCCGYEKVSNKLFIYTAQSRHDR